MSNPFDSFAADFQAALPPGAPGAAPTAVGGYNPNGSFMAPPPQQPVMKAPVMNSSGGYGAPPPQGGYGAPQFGMPPQQQPPMQSMGGLNTSFSSGMAAPPPAQASTGYGGFDQSSSSLGMAPAPMGNPYGSPPPTQFAPPVDNSNPFGASLTGPPADSAYGFGSPPVAPLADASNPFGSPAADSSNPFGSPAPSTQAGYGAPPAQPGYGVPPAQPEFGAPPAQPEYGAQPGYGAPPAQPGYGAPPPPPPDQGAVYGAPPADPQGYGGQQPGYGPPMDGGYGMSTQLGQQQSSGYGMPPADPGFGAPTQDQGYGAPPPPRDQYADPWGSPGGAPPPADPYMGALVPAQQQSNPYAAYGAPPPPQDHGYAAPLPPQQQMQHYQGPPPGAHDPYGAPAYGAAPQHSQDLTPYGAPAVDPFSVFEQRSAPALPPPPPAAPVYQQQEMVPYQPPAAAPSADNLWGDLGFDAPPVAEPPSAAPVAVIEASGNGHSDEKKTGDGSLPPGGEYYDARIFTPTLGVMFFKPQELTDSLFLNTEQSIVDALAERPVVAFIVEGSSARAAGVELGHVLLKVNGVDVKNPKEASRLIKEGPRPLPLLFYVPNTDVVVAEGEHMVKYDTRETTAPNSAKDWKPKYVVIGGIIAQPWMMNMYRSKSEYDIAVIETQARRPVSVKVKQFSLQGARIQNDWQGPQMVKYKNKIHPWKYIVVLPVARNPIKISSPNLSQLKPVHEGIRRVLLAQNRDRSYGQPQQPVRQPQYHQGDQYGHNGGHHDQGGYSQQQQMQQYQAHQHQQQPYNNY